MSNRFKTDEAAFLARMASKGERVTYGTFAKFFGGIANGQGPKLTAMAERLRAHSLPLLPVLVVNAETQLPSDDAAFYKLIGLSIDDIFAEQERCFSYDWTTVPFWKEN